MPQYNRRSLAMAQLPDGNVLMFGGRSAWSNYADDQALRTIERYDPQTRSFRLAGALIDPRYRHTATLLNNGRVLIVGGTGKQVVTIPQASAEVYDPVTETSVAVDSMSEERMDHTATLLQDGRVLIVGGYTGSTPIKTSEIYDPVSGTFGSRTYLHTQRSQHTATLLRDGRVLVTGGADLLEGSLEAELYDPATNEWTLTGKMQTDRFYHSATLLDDGHVLIAGGANSTESALASAELYDPETGSFTDIASMTVPHLEHIAVRLHDGRVAIIGGRELQTIEIYNPQRGVFIAGGTLQSTRLSFGAVLQPNGTVVILGGTGKLETDAETYDPRTRTSTTISGKLSGNRYFPSATVLPNGTVLVAGGANIFSSTYYRAEIYDPDTDCAVPTGRMLQKRHSHQATQLQNGTVLITGGIFMDEPLASAELYNPDTGTFTATGSLVASHGVHRATLLQDGKVLITDGRSRQREGGTPTAPISELYDPARGTFQAVGSMHALHVQNTATLLRDGTVLIVGYPDNDENISAQVYNPLTRTFSTVGGLQQVRYGHTATLLDDGTVLIAGGRIDGKILSSTEIYDPVRRSFTPGPKMSHGRWRHSATLMRDGSVIFTGGQQYDSTWYVASTVESVDPATYTSVQLGVIEGWGFYSTVARLDEHTLLLIDAIKGIEEIGRINVEQTFTGTLTVPTGWVTTATPTLTVTGSATGTMTLDASVNDAPWFALQPNVAATTTLSLTDGIDRPVLLRLRDVPGKPVVVVRGTIDVDTTAPESTMQPLPATSSPTFALRWSGADTTSGVAGYDVEARQEPNGAWEQILSDTTAVTATFSGQVGRTYQFRVRARDVAGNVEAWPDTFDTSTTVQTATVTPTATSSATPTATATATTQPSATATTTATTQPSATATTTARPTMTPTASAGPSDSQVFLPSIAR